MRAPARDALRCPNARRETRRAIRGQHTSSAPQAPREQFGAPFGRAARALRDCCESAHSVRLQQQALFTVRPAE
jgi:hypothetical protein